MLPVSKLAPGPPVLLAVWVWLSLFFRVTASPTETFRAWATKPSLPAFSMLTCWVLAPPLPAPDFFVLAQHAPDYQQRPHHVRSSSARAHGSACAR